jgi:hypothetical protein
MPSSATLIFFIRPPGSDTSMTVAQKGGKSQALRSCAWPCCRGGTAAAATNRNQTVAATGKEVGRGHRRTGDDQQGEDKGEDVPAGDDCAEADQPGGEGGRKLPAIAMLEQVEMNGPSSRAASRDMRISPKARMRNPQPPTSTLPAPRSIPG